MYRQIHGVFSLSLIFYNLGILLFKQVLISKKWKNIIINCFKNWGGKGEYIFDNIVYF